MIYTIELAWCQGVKTGTRINYQSESDVTQVERIYMSHMSHGGYYRQTSNVNRTLVGNKIVDHSDGVGASPVGAAPTTSSFST